MAAILNKLSHIGSIMVDSPNISYIKLQRTKTMAKEYSMRFASVAGVMTIMLSIILAVEAKGKDERDCEVCINALKKFKDTLKDDVISNVEKIETAFRKHCKAYPKGGKENRFCYFIGGTEDAATGILGEISRPLSYHMPVEKICQKLKTKDSQICDLRFDVKPDFSKLNKMRVGELKKILSNWGEDNACKGCAEKSDFVKKVKELLPKYDPEEYKKLQEKSEL